MKIDAYEFGKITVDGVVYDHDIVIDRGRVFKRRKEASQERRAEFGHTPLTAEENIPWGSRKLWIGIGAHGRLPVADDLLEEAARRGVELTLKTTPELVRIINAGFPADANAILHVTC